MCPQWDVTLVFQNLMHVGNRETAEEIVGNVVVECYDYDEVSRMEQVHRKGDISEFRSRMTIAGVMNALGCVSYDTFFLLD